MKNLILILFLTLTPVSFSQDRVNLKPITFDTLSKKIDNITGWAYNDELGEWFGYKNKISNDKSYQTDVNTKNWYIYEDFSSLQFGIILEEYYVLIVSSGTSKKAFVFEQSEYGKITNIFTDSIEMPETGKWVKTFDTIQGQIIESGYWVADKTRYESNSSKTEVQSIRILCSIDKYVSESEEDFLRKIRSSIIDGLTNKIRSQSYLEEEEGILDSSSDFFVIKRTTSNGKDVIRFLLPFMGLTHKYSYNSVEELINDKYFEINSKEFKSFLLQ